MRKLHVFYLVMLTSLFGSSAQAENFITPDWSSDRVLNHRAQGYDTAIVMAFQSETKTDKMPVIVQSGMVRLWHDFDHVSSEVSEILTDYRLCRVFSWKPADPTFDNHSCYAGPAFGRMELHNRLQINKMLRGTGVSEGAVLPVDDPFWIEQEFGKQLKSSDPLTRKKSDDSLEWRLGNTTVTKASAAGFSFPREDRQRFARYLARYLKIHPQVRREILDSGIMPFQIKIYRRDFKGQSVEEITFSSFQMTKAEYPLPRDLTSSVELRSRGESIEALAIRKTIQAIAGNAQPPRSSFDELLKRLEAAAKRQASLETALIFFELSQLYAGVLMNEEDQLGRLRRLMPMVEPLLGSKEVANLMQASNLAGSAGEEPEREAAAAYLANAKRLDQMDFGTFRYVTFANLFRISKGTDDWDKRIFQKMPSFTDSYLTHIAAYPWASNAFKDLGDTWYGQFETFRAWEAWDFGRAVDPDWERSAMQSIAGFEEQVRAAMPDSF